MHFVFQVDDDSDDEVIPLDLAQDDRDSLDLNEKEPVPDIEQDNGYDTDLEIDDDGKGFLICI